jgi:hypothetical protein
MKSYCDFISDNSLDWSMRTRSAESSDQMPRPSILHGLCTRV